MDLAVQRHDDWDLTQLISQRKQHETRRAAKAVRIGSNPNEEDPAEEAARKKQVPSARQQLNKEIHAVLREYSDKGIGTGLERDMRWKSKDGSIPQTGNALNATLVAGQRAGTVG